ncbi:MAG: alpha/beta hydrolase [Magnetococcales bacterium]|nr:alpha/beta hydrolase [Magnetococcales bacterium]
MLPSLLLAGCVGFWSTPTERLLDLARQGGLQRESWQSGPFHLTVLVRDSRPEAQTLVVYLEGDGLAWLDRNRLSPDPTPIDSPVVPMLLRDPAPKVLYLARPCQYVGGLASGCAPKYWSTHRYAPEVVTALSQAIDRAKGRLGVRQIGLIGYSGGGVIAALLAAARDDVAWWITVAANLDLTAWTRHHGVSSMPASRDPVDFVARLARLPQAHFMGGRDRQVPESVTRAFLDRLPPGTPLQSRVLADFDHGCCWSEAWPTLLDSVAFRRNPLE